MVSCKTNPQGLIFCSSNGISLLDEKLAKIKSYEVGATKLAQRYEQTDLVFHVSRFDDKVVKLSSISALKELASLRFTTQVADLLMAGPYLTVCTENAGYVFNFEAEQGCQKAVHSFQTVVTGGNQVASAYRGG